MTSKALFCRSRGKKNAPSGRVAAKPFSWYLAPHSGLIVFELRGRRFYLNRPSDRLAFRRRVFAPLRHRMTPTFEGDALAGHFRANKNIAPRGLSLHRRFSGLTWFSLMCCRMSKKENHSALSVKRIKAEWLPTDSMFPQTITQYRLGYPPKRCALVRDFC